ncbi:unnamed protein product [Acidithrix sp. C25]|nr:unnamed protein product [Acidithrix sp. C25]
MSVSSTRDTSQIEILVESIDTDRDALVTLDGSKETKKSQNLCF